MDTTVPRKRVTQELNGNLVRQLAAECGFGLAGVASPFPAPDFSRYHNWMQRGLAGEMRYLTDHRAEVRSDPEKLLSGVRSIICVGKAYNGPQPYSTDFNDAECAWISRYAWGEDYHPVLRRGLEQLAARLSEHADFRWRACVDTAPLLERSYAHQAGLGWIGKNTCLINQESGSWYFLGELLTTLDLPADRPPQDRCGTCSRCIDACPTEAIIASPMGGYELDARLCISYFTIELRGAIPEKHRSGMGSNVFGCDICQDVCPWNSPRRAAVVQTTAVEPPRFERLASLTREQFQQMFRHTPVSRAKYSGFLRNVAVAMGNAGLPHFREPLQKLAASDDPLVAEHAHWALRRIR